MPCPICDEKPINCQCTEAELRMYYEIEELEEKVPRWIPVSERRPEVGQEILCFLKGEVYLGRYVPWPKWTDCTHWMPLPEPPECP